MICNRPTVTGVLLVVLAGIFWTGTHAQVEPPELEQFACTTPTSGEPVTCEVGLSRFDDVEVCLFSPDGTRSRCCFGYVGDLDCEIDGFDQAGTWRAELRTWDGNGRRTLALDPTAIDALGFSSAVDVVALTDQDGDGVGVEMGDCNDQDPTVYPGATELCDGRNNDCLVFDWPAPSHLERDVDLDLATACDGDCNDEASGTSHLGLEVCDTFDNDCDGEVDERPECPRDCGAPALVRASTIFLPSWGVRSLTPRRATWNGQTIEVITHTYGEDTNEYPEETVVEHVYGRIDADGQYVEAGFLGDTIDAESLLEDAGISVWTGSRHIRLWRQFREYSEPRYEFRGVLLPEPALHDAAWSGSALGIAWTQRDRIYFAHDGRVRDSKVLSDEPGVPTRVLWTGEAFAVFWDDGNQQWGARVDAAGRRVGDRVPVPATPALWTGTAFVATWVEDGEIWLSRLGPDLVELEPAIPLTQGPYASIAWHEIAWTGEELGLVWKGNRMPDDRERIHFARFAPDGTRLIDDHPFAYREVPYNPIGFQWTGNQYVLLLFDEGRGEAWLIRCDCVNDADGDTVPECSDCADDSPTVFPGAPQRCNGINDDCYDFAYPDPYPGESNDAIGQCAGLCGAFATEELEGQSHNSADVSGDNAIVAVATYVPFLARIFPHVEFFHHDAGGWNLERSIHPDNGNGEAFAAIDGETAVVGWPAQHGEVTIHSRSAGGPGQWGQIATLTVPVVGNQSRLVDIDGTRIAVANAQSAFVFERDHGGSGNWGQTATLGRAGFRPMSVAIEGNIMAMAVFGYPDDNWVQWILVYEFANGTWTEVTTLEPTAQDPEFGVSLAADGQHLAAAGDTGVYVYQRDDGGNWNSIAHLTSDVGTNVDLDGDRLLTGDQVYVMTPGPASEWRRVPIPEAGRAISGDTIWARFSVMQAYDWDEGYEDRDADGFGGAAFLKCGDLTAFAGYANVAGDCADNDPSVYPGALELCDGVNNDCLDPLWPFSIEDGDIDGDGTSLCAGDCDDRDPSSGPGRIEVCDGADNDCDLAVDEGDPGAVQHLFDFDAEPPGADPADWLDTGAGNSLEFDDVFEVFDLDGERVFGSTVTANHIHSHFAGEGNATLSDYTFSGRFRIDDPETGIGFTVLSDYPNSNSYYYLRRLFNDHELRVRTHGIATPVCTPRDTGVDPGDGAWYRFELRVDVGPADTWIGARVWRESDPVPLDWQVECVDDTAERRTTGTFGIWGFGSGGRYFDDLRLVTNAGQDCSSDVGTCTSGYRSCENGTFDCSGVEPAPETCDGLDNDCDGGLPAAETDGDGDELLACADAMADWFVSLPTSGVVTWSGDGRVELWNLYTGDLTTLLETGIYTQAPGSNPLAGRECGLTTSSLSLFATPAPGSTAFYLVTGIEDGTEGPLGADGQGELRINAAACP